MAARLAALAVLLTTACASAPGDRGSPEATQRPPRGGIVEFRLTSYNGRDLEGRVLVGATVDPLLIGGYMLDGGGVELRDVRACGKTELQEFLMADAWVLKKPEPVITLRPGYWYGRSISFPALFLERETGPGPDCFEANLMVLLRGVGTTLTLPIRVERTDKPLVPPAGGAPAAPKPPAPDGGTP